ncbi:hypothetical protein [Streptomyces mirabilis]|uniref:hypothetical protein n=1 Tax=Streptomyces mirabilis TaxID=68239 RepID=UPI0033B21920
MQIAGLDEPASYKTWVLGAAERVELVGEGGQILAGGCVERDTDRVPRLGLTAPCPQTFRTRVVALSVRGLAFSGQASDRLCHAVIRDFSYSAWTSRGAR